MTWMSVDPPSCSLKRQFSFWRILMGGSDAVKRCGIRECSEICKAEARCNCQSVFRPYVLCSIRYDWFGRHWQWRGQVWPVGHFVDWSDCMLLRQLLLFPALVTLRFRKMQSDCDATTALTAYELSILGAGNKGCVTLVESNAPFCARNHQSKVTPASGLTVHGELAQYLRAAGANCPCAVINDCDGKSPTTHILFRNLLPVEASTRELLLSLPVEQHEAMLKSLERCC